MAVCLWRRLTGVITVGQGSDFSMPALSLCSSLDHMSSFSVYVQRHPFPLLEFNVISLCSRKLLMYAPLEEQPKQSLTREEMTEVCVQS